ncbi:MAG: ferredoxin reductase [Marmoricola sp.]
MTEAPAGSVVPRRQRLRWQTGRLRDAWLETRDARTMVFDVPGWPGHAAGQHVDLRLTADDGYTAQRSYSIASSSAPGRLELTVQLVTDGEVSPYLVEVMQVGDELDLRGPIGGWFQWTPPGARRLLLIGGGSGVVPLMAMLRQRRAAGDRTPCRLIYSVRTPDHVYYAHELHTLAAEDEHLTIDLIHTRSAPPRDPRGAGRLAMADLGGPPIAEADRSDIFVCGPTGFVESVAAMLVDVGHTAATIRTERFGASGA